MSLTISNEQAQDESNVVEELFKFDIEFNYMTTSNDDNINSNLADYDDNSNHYQQLKYYAKELHAENNVAIQWKVEEQAIIDLGYTSYGEFASVLQEKSQCSHSEINGSQTSVLPYCIHPNNLRDAASLKCLKHSLKCLKDQFWIQPNTRLKNVAVSIKGGTSHAFKWSIVRSYGLNWNEIENKSSQLTENIQSNAYINN